ncbi:MAG: 1-deoxy-D-xylulose-5-phosphate synthase [Waddliaceae bacterium]
MKSLLSEIHTPEQIKNFSIEELKALAKEIHERIVEVMSKNGGHLASNLGSIELTIALHKVFNSPIDKFIWDVSHQTYTHKLLTGRDDAFDKVRQSGGSCGFSHPKESAHDHFHAGHAGTALSLALGKAAARDLDQREEYIVPVIGDATLTCGMAYEALNNISRDLKKFIVVLNDNRMSISKNVGAITHILSRWLSNPTTHRLHQEVDAIVSKIPTLGSLLSSQGRKLADSLKNLVSPAAFFDHFGLSYIGPIDGHDIKKLVDAFEGIKDSEWPVIIHVLTNKGNGMSTAMENPSTYHGAKPFYKDTGTFIPQPSKNPTFPKVFGTHLLQMAEKDKRIVVVTPAMSSGSGIDPMMEKLPDRCIDVGIAESHAVTFAGGIAHDRSKRVIVSIYATFLQRAFDNLFHDVCIQEIPVVFAIDRAGLSAGDGITHHGIYDISFLNAMPNMIISQPRNAKVLKELMESSFDWGHPAAIRYPNQPTDLADGELQTRTPGEAEILERGDDLIILALGHMCETALEVRNKLLEKGIHATVVDPVFIKPLDSELLCELLSKQQRLVTIEEHSVVSGMGAIVNHFLMSKGYSNVEVLNIGIPETFVEHGGYSDIMNALGLTSDTIVNQIIQSFTFTSKVTMQRVL